MEPPLPMEAPVETPFLLSVVCLAVGACLLAVTSVGGAGEIRLRPSSDGAPVIVPALEAPATGATIRLSAGVYREPVTITRSLTLVGDDGAVIDLEEQLTVKWEAALTLGKGVYRAAVSRRPVAIFVDGKPVAQLNDERPEPAEEGGTWFWKHVIANGPKGEGLAIIKGLWMYRPEEGAVYMHLEGDGSPAARACTGLWDTTSVVTLRDARDAHVRNLTLTHGYHGVLINGTSQGCSVVACRITHWESTGVTLEGAATNCLIENNEVSRAAFEDVGEFAFSAETYDHVWRVHKDAGMWDRVGIIVWGAGSGNRVSGNHVKGAFDGIDVHTPEGYWYLHRIDEDPMQNTGTEVSENLIEDCRDSGIELGGSLRDVKVHHNTLRRTLGGLRYKSPRFGPIYIYRNVLIDNAINIWYSMDDSPAEGYVYHNTVIGGDCFLRFGGWDPDKFIGAQNFHYLNNLSLAPKGFYQPRGKRLSYQFIADYNVVTNGGRPYPGNPYRDTHSRYVESAELQPGFPPKPAVGSAAIDAGLDLSGYLHGHPLPGCEPGYFRGKAPDAGAVEVE
jgi:hypothetical protein